MAGKLDADTFKMRLDAVPRLLPEVNEEIKGARNREGADIVINRPKPAHDKRDLKPKKVLCSLGKFAVAEMEDGKVVVMWEGHADVATDRAGAMALLNSAERAILEAGINEVG